MIPSSQHGRDSVLVVDRRDAARAGAIGLRHVSVPVTRDVDGRGAPPAGRGGLSGESRSSLAGVHHNSYNMCRCRRASACRIRLRPPAGRPPVPGSGSPPESDSDSDDAVAAALRLAPSLSLYLADHRGSLRLIKALQPRGSRRITAADSAQALRIYSRWHSTSSSRGPVLPADGGTRRAALITVLGADHGRGVWRSVITARSVAAPWHSSQRVALNTARRVALITVTAALITVTADNADHGAW